MLDYERHARQIALAELGPDGQRKLAETPVSLAEAPPIAAELHRRAGGVTLDGASVHVTLAERSNAPSWELGASAWAAVEAARRVLGEPSREMPAELSSRLRGA